MCSPSDKGRFGSVQTEVIVRRQISLTPSVPRFVRVGDGFEAGIIVTVSGGSISGVPITVDLEIEEESREIISFQTDTKTKVETNIDGQVEIRFGLKAEALGKAKFIIRAGAVG